MPDRASKFLFDAQSAALNRTTGWERYTRALSHRLARRGVRVVTPRFGGHVGAAWNRIVLPLECRTGDVAHFPTYPPLFPVRGCTVVTIHDLVWWRYPEASSRLGRDVYRVALERALLRGAHVVSPSMAVAEEAKDLLKIPDERVTAVPNGTVEFVTSGTQTLPPPARMRPYCLSVGTVEPRKNYDRLVEGFRMSRANKSLDLVIVGRAAWGSLPQGVVALGAVSDQHLASLYRGASMYVSASLYEGFGLPLVEAMSFGIPIACSRIPAYEEVVGSLATYFDPMSIDDIAAKLDLALESSSQASALQLQQRATLFTWDAAADKLVNLYQLLGGERPRAREIPGRA